MLPEPVLVARRIYACDRARIGNGTDQTIQRYRRRGTGYCTSRIYVLV